LDATVNVVPLLKIDIFKEVTPHGSGGNRIAIHLDSRQLRNCALYRHQALAQVFVDIRRDKRVFHPEHFTARRIKAGYTNSIYWASPVTPFSVDFSRWYAARGAFVLVVVLGLAFYGMRVSLAAQSFLTTKQD
jgi:hypothetical protein